MYDGPELASEVKRCDNGPRLKLKDVLFNIKHF